MNTEGYYYWWEWRRPRIYAFCLRCGVTIEDVETNRVVVSPRNTAHFGKDGRTNCGKDATGDGWWWPL